jgi:flagellar motor switch/type III secretory pathway protein FliN
MACPSRVKLIDLLYLRPGALLSLHAVRGEAYCQEVEEVIHTEGWQQDVSTAWVPDGNSLKIHNLAKLLDIFIDLQIIIRHPDGKLIEMLRVEPQTWSALLDRAGHRAEVMVNGRVIAEGEIINTAGQSGIRITRLAGI